MKMRRFYIDTSVVGGCLDEEFQEQSLALLDLAKRGEVLFLISDLLRDEIRLAPAKVQQVLMKMPIEALEPVFQSEETERLGNLYMKESVVGPASRNDALHVAIATIARADLIISWNFKHLVHVDKILAFNSINLREGYGFIDIRSPLEVV